MRKILTIDDQPDNLVSLKALIKSSIPNCEVSTALSGKEGIEIALKEKPDTIILDVIMPGMDGYEVCKILKSEKETACIPIIMLTAIDTDTSSKVKGLELGADGFFSKPIDPAELTAQLKAMLRIKEAEDKLREKQKALGEIVKTTTTKLDKTSEQLRRFMDSAPDSFLLLDSELNLLDINQAGLNGWNKNIEDVIEKNITDLEPGIRDTGLYDIYKNVMASGKPYHVDDVVFNKTDKRHFSIRAFKVGEGLGIITTDITEQKKSARELIKSEKKFSTAFRTSPYIITIIRMEDGGFIDVNEAFVSITGFTREEVLQDTFVSRDIWNDSNDRKKFTEDLENAKNVEMQEFLFRKKNGDIFPAIISSCIVELEGEECIFSSIEDISERKLAQDKLLKSQYYLIKSQELGLVGTWELDLLKNRLIWTDENYKIFGVRPGTELNYEIFLDCIHPDDRDYVHEKWNEALGGEPYDIELRLIVDDEIKWVREKAEIEFDDAGKPLIAIGLTQDITEIKTTEHVQAAQLRLIDYAVNHSIEELLQKFLDEAEVLTGSEIGFYHFVKEDQLSVELKIWSANTVDKMSKEDVVTRQYPIAEAGVWVDCVKDRRPVIHNDYSSLTHKKGLPDGHIPISRELVVPVIREEKIVAVLGVGNKKTNYVQQDVNTVQHLADVAWEIIGRKQSETDLIISEKKHKDLFEHMNEAFALHEIITDDNGKPVDYRYLEVNPAFEKNTGLDIKKVLGKTVREILPGIEHDPANWIGKYGKVALTGKELVFEGYSQAIGEWYLVQAFSPQKGLFAVTFTNITERKKAEAQILEINSLLSSVIESPSNIIIFSLNMHYCYTSFNKRHFDEMKKLYGVKIEKGKNMLDYINIEKVKPLVLKSYDRVLAGESFSEIQQHPGADIYYELFWNPILNQNKKITGLSCFIQDISDRKKAEKEIMYNAERFKRWQASNFIGIVQSNPEGGISDANDTFLAMLGYSKGDLLEGRINWKASTPLEYLHLEKEALIEASDKGYWTPYEKEYFHKDGSRVPVIIGGSIYKENPEEYIVFVIDITERKVAEDEIRRSKILLESSIESPKDMIILSLDLEYRYLYFNKIHADGMMVVSGARPQIGECIFDNMAKNEIEKLKEHYDRAIKGEGHIAIEGFSRDQLRFYYEVKYNPIYNEKNEIIGVTSFAHNITDRKLAEETLKISEERLRLSTEIAGIAVWEYDFDKNKMDRSKNHDQLYGLEWQEDRFIDSCQNAIHPDDRERFNRIIQESMTPGGHPQYNCDFRVIWPDESVHWLSLFGEVVERDEKSDAILIRGCLMDITERKKSEEELKKHREHLEELVIERTKELQDKNTELERFNKLFIDREFRIKELKDKIKMLEHQQGK